MSKCAISCSNYVKIKSDCGGKRRKSLLAVKSLSRNIKVPKIPIARDSDYFDTPTVLLREKSCLEEKSSEKSGTSPPVYASSVSRRETALNLRKEMSPARGDLYIRFARRCEPSDILDIRIRANGQVRSPFARHRISDKVATPKTKKQENVKSVIFFLRSFTSIRAKIRTRCYLSASSVFFFHNLPTVPSR